MSYIAPNSPLEIKADLAADLGVFSTPSNCHAPAALLEGSTVFSKQVGRDNWQRTVHSALAENAPAEPILARETQTPSGNWRSFPPHEHDRSNPPQEATLDEIYYLHVKPAHGFGFIWAYTPPQDHEGFANEFVVEDGDTIALPRGYHPVVAAPDYELDHTLVLAGEERGYGARADDPPPRLGEEFLNESLPRLRPAPPSHSLDRLVASSSKPRRKEIRS